MAASTSPVILALDLPTLKEAVEMARRTAPFLAAAKIGSQLFTAEGPVAVRAMHDLGLRVFLDLKFHDIPNTVAGAVTAAAGMGVWILNVHGSGGGAMLGAAARAGASAAPRPLILAVTILTSLAPEEIGDLFGTTRTLLEQVGHLATLAQTAGLDGVVASPHEIALVRKVCGARFLIVTPGVRPADAERGDQRRVMTPSEAVRAGADYVVVGRPILAASDPADAARRIVAEIGR